MPTSDRVTGAMSAKITDLKRQNEALLDGLRVIISNASKTEPRREAYHNMETAYADGMEVAWWEAAKIARKAIEQAEEG